MSKKVIAIITAVNEEQDAIIQAFSGHKHEVEEVMGLKFYVIDLQKIKVVTVLGGCGKVNAGSCTSILIYKYRPECVFNVGVAGGFKEDQKILDIVVSTGFLYTDVDIECLDYLPGQIEGCPQIFDADKELINIVSDVQKKEFTDVNFHYGIIGSGDQFISRPDQVERIKSKFPNVACVEMEGCAIAHVCHRFKTRVAAIRTLSDIAVADHDNSVDFTKTCKIASERGAKFALKLAEHFSK